MSDPMSFDWPFDDASTFRTFTDYPYTMRMALVSALARRFASMLKG